jgi:CRISPR-associated endonuclease/helicase Cas3
MTFYAHSLPGQPQDQWQPLETHLAQTADLAARFAAPFQSEEWARLAGWLHDLGKADSAFQGYLFRENGLDESEYDSGKVNHSSAGAAYAVEKLGDGAGRILAYLVAGHHAGLPDWHSDTGGNGALSVRLDPEGKQNLDRIRTEAQAFLNSHLSLTPPPEFTRKAANVHLWMRMLYSCLVDADFLNTEEFMDPPRRPNGPITVP